MPNRLTKKQMSLLITLLILLILGFAQSQQPAPVTQPTPLPSPTVSPQTSPVPSPVLGSATASPSSQLHRVARVVDGDTIRVLIADKEEIVRLVGINAPESVDRRVDVQCLGVESSNYLKTLLDGVSVMLEPDPTQSDRDRYGRLLRFAFLPDGTDVGLKLLAEGYAVESLYSAKPHRYRELYVEAQQQAQAQQKGLWNPATCPLPSPI